MSEVISLTCKKCEIEKSPSEFYSRSGGKYRTNACKKCTSSSNKKTYKNKKFQTQIVRKQEELDREIREICSISDDLPFNSFSMDDVDTIILRLENVLDRAKFLKDRATMKSLVLCVVIEQDISESDKFIINVSMKNIIRKELKDNFDIDILQSDIEHKDIPPNRIKFTYSNDDLVFNDIVDKIKNSVRDKPIYNVIRLM